MSNKFKPVDVFNDLDEVVTDPKGGSTERARNERGERAPKTASKTASSKRSRKQPEPAEESDDESDYSSVSDYSDASSASTKPPRTWLDWIDEHRLLIAIVIIVIIVVCIIIYFFSFRPVHEMNANLAARQKLPNMGPPPPGPPSGVPLGAPQQPPQGGPGPTPQDRLAQMREAQQKRNVSFVDTPPEAPKPGVSSFDVLAAAAPAEAAKVAPVKYGGVALQHYQEEVGEDDEAPPLAPVQPEAPPATAALDHSGIDGVIMTPSQKTSSISFGDDSYDILDGF